MGNKLILLVDDNPADEELTRRALKKSGIPHTVIVARDGAEALDHLMGIEPDQLPDLVLLDLKLPKVSGLDVLAKLRAHPLRRPVPVVVLTSSTKAEDVREAYRLGCNSYIAKNIQYLAFIQDAELLARYWLSMNASPSGEVSRS
jgi:two-component system, response regulator